ncbi:NAD(P)-binding protein [Xylariaceae sp. FL1651]|nr:NAD(P)-binding protein [Xylariaceae sp. FL1651]
MSFNRIAIYGHRGWVGSAVLRAFNAAGAPIRVLHRAGSDISNLPPGVTAAEVDLNNPQTLVPALKDVDIAISFASREAVPLQHAFVKAIPSTNVRLFVPSDLGFRVDEHGMRIPVNKAKQDVEDAAKAAGIPTTVVLVGCFTESALAFPILGVDLPGNRIIETGDSANQQLTFCTRNYVAAAYASIFARTPPAELQGRTIGISELKATGNEIAAVLKERHGAEPQKFVHTLEKVDGEIDRCVRNGIPTALSWYCRRAWGTGDIVPGIGEDIWEVEGYEKATLLGLLLEGKLEPYRDIPPQVKQAFDSAFH